MSLCGRIQLDDHGPGAVAVPRSHPVIDSAKRARLSSPGGEAGPARAIAPGHRFMPRSSHRSIRCHGLIMPPPKSTASATARPILDNLAYVARAAGAGRRCSGAGSTTATCWASSPQDDALRYLPRVSARDNFPRRYSSDRVTARSSEGYQLPRGFIYRSVISAMIAGHLTVIKSRMGTMSYELPLASFELLDRIRLPGKDRLQCPRWLTSLAGLNVRRWRAAPMR